MTTVPYPLVNTAQAVSATAVEAPMLFGSDAADAATFLLDTGPIRFLLERADPTTVTQAHAALVTALRAYEAPGGVRLLGAAWVVTATVE